MPTKTKRSAKEREQLLVDRIEKAKQALAELQHKRQLELGQLVRHHGLDNLDDNQLNDAFAKLAGELLAKPSAEKTLSATDIKSQVSD